MKSRDTILADDNADICCCSINVILQLFIYTFYHNLIRFVIPQEIILAFCILD